MPNPSPPVSNSDDNPQNFAVKMDGAYLEARLEEKSLHQIRLIVREELNLALVQIRHDLRMRGL